MSLDNFRNRTIIWDTVNKNFPQPIQIMQGDVNARTLLIKIVDNGVEIDLTGHSLKLTYQYTNSSNSGFVMIPPENLTKGEFLLAIPTEMTKAGVIEANLILLNESLEQVIVSKNLTFISDNSTVTDLAQEVNNKIDDFTKLLLENMPQVMRSELNDLHAQTESNKSNIELKANLADMTSLQSAMTELKSEVEAFGISPENLVTIKSLLDAIASNASESEVVELINSVKVLTSNISLMSNGDYSPKANQTDLESLQHTVNNQSATISAKANQTDLDNLQATVDKQGIAISTKAEQSELSITNKNVTTAQETAKQAESKAKNAMAKATEVQANSLPLNGNAVSASKLETARKLGVNLQSSAHKNFDGSSDVTDIGVSGVLPIANGGTATSDGVINTIAYANSSDGTGGFTTVYPNLNLLTNSRLQSGNIEPFYPINNTVLTINSSIKGLDVSHSGGAVSYQQGVGNGIIPVSAGKQYTMSVKVINTGTVVINKFLLQFGFYNSSGTGLDFPNKIFSIPADGKAYSLSFTYTVPANITSMRVYYLDIATSANVAHTFTIYDMKAEEGSTATPWMPSAREVTTADYPKYVGFSNSIKPNKTNSDYKWLPISGQSGVSLKLNLPPEIYAVTGKEVNIYFDNIANLPLSDYQVDVTCSLGKQMSNHWTANPTNSGNYPITIAVYKNFKMVAQVNSTIKVKESTVGSGIKKDGMIMGDSTIAQDYLINHLEDMFGTDPLTINFKGTHGTYGELHNEGYSGWTVHDLRTNKTYNDVVNPFYNPIKADFDFSYYMTNQGYTGLDYVVLCFGINDTFNFTDDSTLLNKIPGILTDFNYIISNIHAYDSNIKIGICVTTPPNANQDAFGNSYYTGQTQWRYKRNNALWIEQLINTFKYKTPQNIYLVPDNSGIDATIGFRDGVHPNQDVGEKQRADTFYSWFKSFEM